MVSTTFITFRYANAPYDSTVYIGLIPKSISFESREEAVNYLIANGFIPIRHEMEYERKNITVLELNSDGWKNSDSPYTCVRALITDKVEMPVDLDCFLENTNVFVTEGHSE